MNPSIKVVAYDGISSSGKSSLILAIRNKQIYGKPHNIIPIDRWTPSLWAFKKMSGGEENLEYLSKGFIDNNIPFGIVWCDAPIEICLERSHRKKDIFHEPMQEMQNLLEEYFSNICSVPYIRVKTDHNIEVCANEVWEWIQKL